MPKVSASLPGRTWKNGFFSIGSHASTPTYPCGTSSVPSTLKRTRQTPSRPGLTRQRWPQAKHCTAPPSLRSISASAAGTLYSCSISLSELRRDLSCSTSRGMRMLRLYFTHVLVAATPASPFFCAIAEATQASQLQERIGNLPHLPLAIHAGDRRLPLGQQNIAALQLVCVIVAHVRPTIDM